MKLFSIGCATCKSSLQVRDSAIVGQIIACPKCGSMVLVQPPPDWNPPDDEKSTLVAESPQRIPIQPPSPLPTRTPAPLAKSQAAGDPLLHETMGDEAFDDVSGILGENKNDPEPIRSGGAKASSESNATAKQPGMIAPGAKADSRPGAAPQTVVGAATATSAPAGGQEGQPVWLEKSDSRPRIYAFVALMSIAGIGLTIAMAQLLKSYGSSSTESVVSTKPKSMDFDNRKGLEGKKVENPSKASEAPPTSDEPAKDATEEKVRPAEPERDPQKTDENPTSRSAESPSEKEDEEEKSPIIEAPPEDGDVASDSLRSQVVKRWLNGNDVEVAKTTEHEEVASDETTENRDLAPKPEPRPVVLEERLEDAFVGIAFENVKLTDFVDFVQKYSTIPIAFDLDALEIAGAAPTAPVSFKAKGPKVTKVLEKTLEGVGLVAEAGESGVLVITPAVVIPHTEDVGEIFKEDESRKELLAWLQDWVAIPSAEDTDAISLVDGSVTIKESSAVSQCRRLVEQIRAARLGGHSKCRSYQEKKRFAAEKLAAPVNLHYLHGELLTTILARLSSTTDCVIVADWKTLYPTGWTPDTKLRLSVGGGVLSDALDQICKQMGARYRVIPIGDLCCVEIYLDDRAAVAVSEWYSLPASVTKESAPKLLSELSTLLKEGEPLAKWLRYDDESHSLFARLPHAQHEALVAKLASLESN